MLVKMLLCVPVFWIVAIIFFNLPSNKVSQAQMYQHYV